MLKCIVVEEAAAGEDVLHFGTVGGAICLCITDSRRNCRRRTLFSLPVQHSGKQTRGNDFELHLQYFCWLISAPSGG